MNAKTVLIVIVCTLIGVALAFTPWVLPLTAFLMTLGIAAAAAVPVLAIILGVVGCIIGLLVSRLFSWENKAPNQIKAQMGVDPNGKKLDKRQPTEPRSVGAEAVATPAAKLEGSVRPVSVQQPAAAQQQRKVIDREMPIAAKKEGHNRLQQRPHRLQSRKVSLYQVVCWDP